MSILSLFSFLVLLASCVPQESSTKSAPIIRQNEEYITDIQVSDLLDVVMDVPVEISNSQILFMRSSSQMAQGVRTSCSLEVKEGEVYSFILDGNFLQLKKNTGKVLGFKRVSGEKEGLQGSWVHKSQENRQLILRRLSIVGTNRVIMRTHCEG
jgi:hypothetical protein